MSQAVIDRINESLTHPFEEYLGKTSYFGGNTPLPVEAGYFVVIGFGALFSVFTTFIVWIDKKTRGNTPLTSESFK